MKIKARLFGIVASALGVFLGGAWARGADRDLPGPIDSPRDLRDSARMLFKMADTNNDNLISQKEAIDAGNLLVGGFFFRADANGDGVLSQEEARAARESFLRQKPILAIVLREIQEGRAGAQPGQAAQPGQPTQPGQPAQRGGTTQNPLRALGNLIDVNNDRQIQASELRQVVQTTVQGIYSTADTNRDGQLSPSELNAAAVGVARSAAQTAFQAADADGNGSISQAEFDRAIVQPGRLVFRIIDVNDDGQITPQEAQAAQRVLMSQVQNLRVPEPANSPRNLIRSGRAPEQVAPVPTIPPAGRPARPGQAPAPAPATPAPTAPTPAPAPGR